jgi:hypothetical protein
LCIKRKKKHAGSLKSRGAGNLKAATLSEFATLIGGWFFDKYK